MEEGETSGPSEPAPAAASSSTAPTSEASSSKGMALLKGFDMTQTVELGGQRWEFTGGVLGSGAFGVVLDARSVGTDERAAVKVLDVDSMSPWQERQSKSEVELWSSLQHPSIVRFYGRAQLRNLLLLFSEPLDGGELMDHITQCETFVETEVASIMRQLLGAVAHMHEQRICHRDIKPQNVVCAEKPEVEGGEWRVKLCDFGHAKRIDDTSAGDMTLMHTPCGSHQYAAPEVTTRAQHEGRPAYTLAVDLWGLGCILHMLLSGERPPKGAAPQFTSRAWLSVSTDARDLLRRLMMFAPAARPTASQALQHQWLSTARRTPLQTPRVASRPSLPRVVAHAWWSERVPQPAASVDGSYEAAQQEAALLTAVRTIATLPAAVGPGRSTFAPLDQPPTGLASEPSPPAGAGLLANLPGPAPVATAAATTTHTDMDIDAVGPADSDGPEGPAGPLAPVKFASAAAPSTTALVPAAPRVPPLDEDAGGGFVSTSRSADSTPAHPPPRGLAAGELTDEAAPFEAARPRLSSAPAHPGATSAGQASFGGRPAGSSEQPHALDLARMLPPGGLPRDYRSTSLDSSTSLISPASTATVVDAASRGPGSAVGVGQASSGMLRRRRADEEGSVCSVDSCPSSTGNSSCPRLYTSSEYTPSVASNESPAELAGADHHQMRLTQPAGSEPFKRRRHSSWEASSFAAPAGLAPGRRGGGKDPPRGPTDPPR